MSVATSIPDTSLGLTSSEIQILRQQQQIALQGGHAGSVVSRGRGTGRNSNSSSRATSAASSQGRLLLDPMSLRALSHQLDNLQEQIRSRIDYVSTVFPRYLGAWRVHGWVLRGSPSTMSGLCSYMDSQAFKSDTFFLFGIQAYLYLQSTVG